MQAIAADIHTFAWWGMLARITDDTKRLIERAHERQDEQEREYPTTANTNDTCNLLEIHGKCCLPFSLLSNTLLSRR